MLVNTSRVLGMEKIILKRPKRGKEHFRPYRRCIPRCLCAFNFCGGGVVFSERVRLCEHLRTRKTLSAFPAFSIVH